MQRRVGRLRWPQAQAAHDDASTDGTSTRHKPRPQPTMPSMTGPVQHEIGGGCSPTQSVYKVQFMSPRQHVREKLEAATPSQPTYKDQVLRRGPRRLGGNEGSARRESIYKDTYCKLLKKASSFRETHTKATQESSQQAPAFVKSDGLQKLLPPSRHQQPPAVLCSGFLALRATPTSRKRSRLVRGSRPPATPPMNSTHFSGVREAKLGTVLQQKRLRIEMLETNIRRH